MKNNSNKAPSSREQQQQHHQQQQPNHHHQQEHKSRRNNQITRNFLTTTVSFLCPFLIFNLSYYFFNDFEARLFRNSMWGKQVLLCRRKNSDFSHFSFPSFQYNFSYNNNSYVQRGLWHIIFVVEGQEFQINDKRRCFQNQNKWKRPIGLFTDITAILNLEEIMTLASVCSSNYMVY